MKSNVTIREMKLVQKWKSFRNDCLSLSVLFPLSLSPGGGRGVAHPRSELKNIRSQPPLNTNQKIRFIFNFETPDSPSSPVKLNCCFIILYTNT